MKFFFQKNCIYAQFFIFEKVLFLFVSFNYFEFSFQVNALVEIFIFIDHLVSKFNFGFELKFYFSIHNWLKFNFDFSLHWIGLLLNNWLKLLFYLVFDKTFILLSIWLKLSFISFEFSLETEFLFLIGLSLQSLVKVWIDLSFITHLTF